MNHVASGMNTRLAGVQLISQKITVFIRPEHSQTSKILSQIEAPLAAWLASHFDPSMAVVYAFCALKQHTFT
jgi:hypothetical protein